MAGSNTPERVKDVLLEHISRDIKGLQLTQSDMEQMEDMLTLSNRHVQALCEHLDKIFMHGLYHSEAGYWSAVSYFTRTEAVRTINQLPAVKTYIGRGRAWLYLALSEQSMESYVRMLMDNQEVLKEYYLRDAFLRDLQRLVILQTLVAGLDFVTFDLAIESDYLDYGATRSTATLGTLQSNNFTPDIQPSFIASVTPISKKVDSSWLEDIPKAAPPVSGFSVTGTIGKDGRKEAPAVSNTTGGSQEDDLRSSFSPHRTLTQTESRGTGEEAGLLESGSGSYSPHSSLTVPHNETLQRMIQQGGATGGAEGEDELVVRKSKSKGKAKKKKKRKKPKMSDADDTGTSQSVAVTMPSIATTTQSVAMTTAATDMAIAADDQAEADGDQMEGADSSPQPSRAKEGEEEEEERGRVNSPEEQEMPWEHWTLGGGVVTSEGGAEPALGEYTEECDVGFDRLHPVTLPQPAASNKRLSLADELELAMERDPSPEAGRSRHDDILERSTEATPHLDPTPGGTDPPPTLDPTPSNTVDRLSSEEAQQENPADATPPSDTPPSDTPPTAYEAFPRRPNEITVAARQANDVEIDDTTRLVISLDVLHQEDENLLRLVQVATPTGVGQQRTCYVLITSLHTYVLRREGIEGHFSRELSIKYSDYEHIVIGLGWQSLHLIYHGTGSGESVRDSLWEYIILTGSEAVSRGITDSIRSAAAACPDFMRSIPLNKDDEARVNAIEKELIKLGSETSMDIVEYFLVNWEQLSGDGPTNAIAEVGGVTRSGYLSVKTTNLLGIATWKPSYFVVRDGHLYQFSSEDDDSAKNVYQIRNCGGCVRAPGESKFAVSILGSDQTVMVVLAANSEEDLTNWMQTLCEAVIEQEMPGSPSLRKTCFSCALLLTQNKVHVLQEDWIKKSVQLVASCSVTDVNDISVDKLLPLYCTINYDNDDENGLWLICFETEYELGKFEAALGSMWKEEFQISLTFSEVDDVLTRQRAHRAVELMQGSKSRSDSMTKGRTEFTYSSHY